VSHDQLRFDLVDSVHGHTNNNKERGAAKVEVDPIPCVVQVGRDSKTRPMSHNLSKRMPDIIKVGTSVIAQR